MDLLLVLFQIIINMNHLESYFSAKATEKLKIGFFLARLGPSVCLGSERARTMERSAARERSNRIFDYGNSATSRMQHHVETSPNPLREGYQAENPWLRYFPRFALSRGFTCPVTPVPQSARGSSTISQCLFQRWAIQSLPKPAPHASYPGFAGFTLCERTASYPG